MTALLPFALLVSAGAYLTGAVLTLAGRWNPPVRLPWVAVVLAMIAFGVDREMPQYALVAAPIVFLSAIFIIARIVRLRDAFGLRNALWSLFALIPIAFMVDISIAQFFPATDGSAMLSAAVILLAVPGIAALLAAVVRLISPSPRT